MSHETALRASPITSMFQLITGYWISQAIGSVARLNVADHLADGPRSSAELAWVVGAHPSALHRVLRTLASIGVFAEIPAGADLHSLKQTVHG